MGIDGFHSLNNNRGGPHPDGEQHLTHWVDSGHIPIGLDLIGIDLLADNYNTIYKHLKPVVPNIIRLFESSNSPSPPNNNNNNNDNNNTTTTTTTTTPLPKIPTIPHPQGLGTSFSTSELTNITALFPKNIDSKAEHAVVLLLNEIVSKYAPLAILQPKKQALVLDGFFSVAKENELKKRGKSLFAKQNKSMARKLKVTHCFESKVNALSMSVSDLVGMDVDDVAQEAFEKAREAVVKELEAKAGRAQSDVDRLCKDLFKWSIELAIYVAFVESKYGVLKESGFELRVAAGEADTLLDYLLSQNQSSSLGISRDGDATAGYLHGNLILRQTDSSAPFFQLYQKDRILKKMKLPSPLHLSFLAAVSRNDFVSYRVSRDNLNIVRKLNLDVTRPDICVDRYLDVVRTRKHDPDKMETFREECLGALHVFWRGDQRGLIVDYADEEKRVESLAMINPFYILALKQDSLVLNEFAELFGFRLTKESHLKREMPHTNQHLRSSILDTGKIYIMPSDEQFQKAFKNLNEEVKENRSIRRMIKEKEAYSKLLKESENPPKPPTKKYQRKPKEPDPSKKPRTLAQIKSDQMARAKKTLGITMVPVGRLERSVINAVHDTSLRANLNYNNGISLRGVAKEIARDFILDVKSLMDLVDLSTSYVYKIVGMLLRVVLVKLNSRAFKENLLDTVMVDGVGDVNVSHLYAYVNSLGDEELVLTSHALSGTISNKNQREHLLRLLYRFCLDGKFREDSRRQILQTFKSKKILVSNDAASTKSSPTSYKTAELIDDLDVDSLDDQSGNVAGLEDDEASESKQEEGDDDAIEDDQDEPECDANGQPLKAECKVAREAFKACFPNLVKADVDIFLFNLAACALADNDMYRLLPPTPTVEEKKGSGPLYKAAAVQVATSLANTGVSHFNSLKKQLSSTKAQKFALLRNLEIVFPDNDKRYSIPPLVAAGLANSTRFKISPESDNTPNAHSLSEYFIKSSIISATRNHHSNHTKTFYSYLRSQEFANSGLSISEALIFNAGGTTNDSLRRAMDGVPRYYKYSKSKPPRTERNLDVILGLIERGDEGKIVYENCRIKFNKPRDGKRLPRVIWTGTIVTDTVGFRLQCLPVYDKYGGGSALMTKLKSTTFEVGRMIPEHSAPHNTPAPPSPKPTHNIFLEYDRQLCLDTIQSIRYGIVPESSALHTESTSSSSSSSSLSSSSLTPDDTTLMDVDCMEVDDAPESMTDTDMLDNGHVKKLKSFVSEVEEESFIGVAESGARESHPCCDHGKRRAGCKNCSEEMLVEVIEKVFYKLRVVGADLGVIFAIAACVINGDGSLKNLAIRSKSYYENVTRKMQRYIALLKQRDADDKAKTPETLERDIANLEQCIRNKRTMSPEVFLRYLIHFSVLEPRLREFYGDKKLRALKHRLSTVRQRVFALMTESMFNLGGTNSSTKASVLREREKVELVFAMGLGSGFKVKGHLPSFELKFSRYFQTKCRGLGYLCVGIEELWSSQLCPNCLKVAKSAKDTNDRVKECQSCEIYWNRDVMGGQAHAMIAKTILERGYRPRVYSEPTDDELLPKHRTKLEAWKKAQSEKAKKKKDNKQKDENDDKGGRGGRRGGRGGRRGGRGGGRGGRNARGDQKKRKGGGDSESDSQGRDSKELKRRKSDARGSGMKRQSSSSLAAALPSRATRQKIRAEDTLPKHHTTDRLA